MPDGVDSERIRALAHLVNELTKLVLRLNDQTYYRSSGSLTPQEAESAWRDLHSETRELSSALEKWLTRMDGSDSALAE